MIHIPALKRRVFELSLFFFFFYVSVYGTLSIFQNSIIVRLSKDIMLAWLVFISLVWLVFNKKYPLKYSLLIIVGSLITILVVGMLSLLNGNSFMVLGYGIKITLLPMGAIVFGIYLKSKKYNLHRVLLIVFISLITAWAIQRGLGLERLMQMGFEYAVNVKHFNGNTLRLPSIVGTPDGYAFMLAIVGLMLEVSFLCKNRKKLAIVVKVITVTFLILSTIRSALVLFLICQIVTYFQKIKIANGKFKYLYYSLSLFLLSLFTGLLPKIISSGFGLLNTYSLFDRFNLWMNYLPSLGSKEGIIG
ncbi:hypothetical protein, partial [Neobacillus vireti]|uniref:hypothetical protein n=1 Tax=Neobacillus vireti TaxID=220686 RepID=UPI002FFDEB59